MRLHPDKDVLWEGKRDQSHTAVFGAPPDDGRCPSCEPLRGRWRSPMIRHIAITQFPQHRLFGILIFLALTGKTGIDMIEVFMDGIRGRTCANCERMDCPLPLDLDQSGDFVRPCRRDMVDRVIYSAIDTWHGTSSNARMCLEAKKGRQFFVHGPFHASEKWLPLYLAILYRRQSPFSLKG